MSTASAAAGGKPLSSFEAIADQSLMATLTADPEWKEHQPNKSSRQVKSGHYVPVNPTPLPDPELVAWTPELAAAFGINEAAAGSEDFARFFSGHMDAAPTFKSWCTPYALSIYGQELYQNCPFKNGNGYGDGRAVSIAEVLVPEGTAVDRSGARRWELQLKGAGKTPFCRGADGRAVLRSSVREFLASEAMYHLGVSTTRALSLVVSRSEVVGRPWYKDNTTADPGITDEELKRRFPPHMHPMVKAQLAEQAKQPNEMIVEPVATTCRVSQSFLRVGQVELFARRARKSDRGAAEMAELEAILEYAMAREYSDVPEIADTSRPLADRALSLLDHFSQRLAKLTADWVRVGYVQGNFNSDNCLLSGRTMDYGPFGYIERFEPLWNMWIGGGEHFGFLNQPVAGEKNFGSMVSAVMPVMEAASEGHAERARGMVATHEERAYEALDGVWRDKLGLRQWSDGGRDLVKRLFHLMKDAEADYTMVWRQLAHIPERFCSVQQPPSDAELVAPLEQAFYKPLSEKHRGDLAQWTRDWLEAVRADGGCEAAGGSCAASKVMRSVSPKYIPREWILKSAYRQAEAGDYSEVRKLQKVFAAPYDEQPEVEATYYSKAPPSAAVGGVAFMP